MRTLMLAAFSAATLFSGVGLAGVDPQYFDPRVKPQDDFFRYVNGRWLDEVVIPPDLARYASFNRLQQENWTRLHQLCEEAARSGNTASGAVRVVSDFYASGMDLAAIEAAGVEPLLPELERIALVKTPADVLGALGRLRMLGVHAAFWFSSAADDKNSMRQIAQISQSGLGLAATDQARDADRDYYLKSDEKSQALRQAYAATIAQMFGYLGDEKAAAETAAETVLALETELARASRSRVELRDPQTNYNLMTFGELQALAGDLDLAAYFKATNAPAFREVDVSQPAFIRSFAELVRSRPVEQWRQYLRWHLVRRAAPYLPEKFATAHFKFFRQSLTGVSAPEPRWKQVVVATDEAVGDALGQLYVQHFFPPEAKARALELVANVRAAMRDRLQTLEWMDEPTRRAAVAKLDAFTVNIGYPETWKDYSGAQIGRHAYVVNKFRADEFEARRVLAKIGGPVDRKEWHMTPPTVNAYYNPSVNGITFPAGILQPPFFDAKADDAVNYGGIGVVIGHEMTHGFDDSGRQYDADGNLKDWWTEESAARFKERAALIVRQFSEYVAIDDIRLNGELTQGENIADLGGLRVAYAALQKALAGKPRTKIDGFTPEQRFFISHATVWRDVMRPAEAVRRARVDPHSPGKWRVNGPLANMEEFAAAFSVPEGSPMRLPPDKRVSIW